MPVNCLFSGKRSEIIALADCLPVCLLIQVKKGGKMRKIVPETASCGFYFFALLLLSGNATFHPIDQEERNGSGKYTLYLVRSFISNSKLEK
jgi:hypothetical protein